MDLDTMTITKAAELVRSGEVSPVELARACLERIEALDQKVNAFITVTAESALEKAQQTEDEIRRGGWCGPLHGIPLALKDLYETAGVRTTAGSKFFQDYHPPADAEAVRRLKAAGVVLLGKLNMHEIALGVTNVNPHYGPCRNPWDLDRVTGGSSGGSAAALASRMCLGSLGTDTGGSIRIPSSLCGVVGLKPTRGRVSLSGVIPLSWNLDHAGPMALTVADAAVLLNAIAGYHPHDPVSADVPVEDWVDGLRGGVRGWRVALASGKFFEEIDPEVDRLVKRAAEQFEDLGAHVEPVELEDARQAAAANGLMVVTDAAAFHQSRLEDRPQDFGADVLQRLQSGAATRVEDYVRARRTQAEMKRRFALLFQAYDILLCPTTPTTAPFIEGEDAVERARQLTRFTAPFNLTGLPALSLPCGFTETGLPVGLQIVSAAWQEAKVLKSAFAIEQILGKETWKGRKPGILENR